MRRLPGKLTYANVTRDPRAVHCARWGCIGRFRAKKEQRWDKQIKDNAVKAAKITNGAITGAKVANGTLTSTQINASTLGTVPTAQTSNTGKWLTAWPRRKPGTKWERQASRSS
jgi:hypothetical protein